MVTAISSSFTAASLAGRLAWAMVAVASGLFLTLLVDRALVRAGEAPAGWMGLRVPLSLGLGVLTILAAMM